MRSWTMRGGRGLLPFVSLLGLAGVVAACSIKLPTYDPKWGLIDDDGGGGSATGDGGGSTADGSTGASSGGGDPGAPDANFVDAQVGVAIPSGPGAPSITAVHASRIGPNLHLEVDGSGFGTQSGLPYVGKLRRFGVGPTGTEHPWCAGADSSCKMDLQYTSWTDTAIVIDGFGTQYGPPPGQGELRPYDSTSIFVGSVQDAGAIYNVWVGDLQNEAPPPLNPNGPTPQVASVTFGRIGKDMHIEIDGAGFGPSPGVLGQYTAVQPFAFTDVTQGSWCAGRANSSCSATMLFTAWDDSHIVLDGFGPEYGSKEKVAAGDAVTITVQNSKGPEFTVWSGTIK